MSPEGDELEEVFRFVYQCPAALLRIRRDGEILLASGVACGLLLSIEPGGDLGNLFDVLDAVDPSLRATVGEFSEPTGVIVDQHQIRISRPGDSPRILALTIVAMTEELCAVALHDVTRVVEQERRLRLTEQRLQAIIDSARDYAIFTLDLQGNLDVWNSSIERLTGLDAETVVGKPLTQLGRWTGTPRLRDLLDRALRCGWTDYAAPHRRGSTEFWGEAIVTALLAPNDEPAGFGVVLRDATAKRRYEEELLRLARSDPLTGALNRRAFLEAAEAELARSERRGAELSVVMLDVDHFKSVNDRHGHGAGDEVLRALTAAATRAMRPADLLARLGGEELAVLAPSTSLAAAANLAERIREAVAAVEIATERGPVRVTISAGVASLPPRSGEPFEELLRRADEALYEAKRAGRNRVHLAPPAPPSRGSALIHPSPPSR